MKLGTFGSCLSLRTIRRLKKLTGGELLTCARHIRSDQFLSYLDTRIPSEDDLLSLLKGVGGGQLHQRLILRNQSMEGIGLHRLPRGTNFFDALQKLDVLLVDNFLDLSAFLWRAGEVDFFSTLDLSDRYERIGYIDPFRSAENYARICSGFLKNNPKLQIVFLPFPHNGYAGDSRRAEWNAKFMSALSLDVPTLPLFEVPKSEQTGHPAHFKQSMYNRYALAVLSAAPAIRPTLKGRIKRRLPVNWW